MYWYVFIYPVILDLQITFQCMYMHINAKAYIDVYFTCTCGFFCCRWHHMWMLIQCKIFDSWNVLPKKYVFYADEASCEKGYSTHHFCVQDMIFILFISFQDFAFLAFYICIFFLLYMGISRTLYTIVSCKLVLYCAFQDNWFPMYKLICEFLTVFV